MSEKVVARLLITVEFTELPETGDFDELISDLDELGGGVVTVMDLEILHPITKSLLQ